jgi:ribose transport system permease protein
VTTRELEVPVDDERSQRVRIRSRLTVTDVLERYMLLLLLCVVVLYFSIARPALYPTMINVRTVLGSQSVLLVVALAAMIPLIAGHFDLSVGAVLGLSSIATGTALARFQLPIPVAIGIGLLIGAGCGAVNGFVVARLAVNPFVATLGSASVIAGLVQWYTGGQPIITGVPAAVTNLGLRNWFGLPRAVLIAAALATVVWYFLRYTPLGRHLQSIGSNKEASRLVGIRVDAYVLLSFVLSGALAGAAGVLNVAYNGIADPGSGPDYTLAALAAVFLGSTAIQPGRFNVGGTIIALFFVAASVTGLTFMQAGPWVQPIFTGSALIIGVALSALLARRRVGSA